MKHSFCITISLCVVLLCSCNNIKKDAVRCMKRTMTELSKDPTSVSFSNIETVFSTDSVAVIHCIVRGKNGFGGMSMSNIEYIYAIGMEKTRESIRDLSKQSSILYNDTEFIPLESSIKIEAILKGREVRK